MENTVGWEGKESQKDIEINITFFFPVRRMKGMKKVREGGGSGR